jgi:hypothetical protein
MGKRLRLDATGSERWVGALEPKGGECVWQCGEGRLVAWAARGQSAALSVVGPARGHGSGTEELSATSAGGDSKR